MLAVHDGDDAVGGGGELAVVGHDEDGAVSFVSEVAHDGPDILARVGVEIAGRLVGEDQHGIVGERPRDGDALGLTAGELLRQLVLVSGEPEIGRGASPPFRGWRSRESLPSRRMGSITFSSAVNSGSRKWNWKTKPISARRTSARRSSPSLEVSMPLT